MSATISLFPWQRLCDLLIRALAVAYRDATLTNNIEICTPDLYIKFDFTSLVNKPRHCTRVHRLLGWKANVRHISLCRCIHKRSLYIIAHIGRGILQRVIRKTCLSHLADLSSSGPSFQDLHTTPRHYHCFLDSDFVIYL